MTWTQYGYVTITAGAIAGGTLLYLSTNRKEHVEPEDDAHIVCAIYERCLALAVTWIVTNTYTSAYESVTWAAEPEGRTYLVPDGTNAPVPTPYLVPVTNATNSVWTETNSITWVVPPPGFVQTFVEYQGRYVSGITTTMVGTNLVLVTNDAPAYTYTTLTNAFGHYDVTNSLFGLADTVRAAIPFYLNHRAGGTGTNWANWTVTGLFAYVQVGDCSNRFSFETSAVPPEYVRQLDRVEFYQVLYELQGTLLIALDAYTGTPGTNDAGYAGLGTTYDAWGGQSAYEDYDAYWAPVNDFATADWCAYADNQKFVYDLVELTAPGEWCATHVRSSIDFFGYTNEFCEKSEGIVSYRAAPLHLVASFGYPYFGASPDVLIHWRGDVEIGPPPAIGAWIWAYYGPGICDSGSVFDANSSSFTAGLNRIEGSFALTNSGAVTFPATWTPDGSMPSPCRSPDLSTVCQRWGLYGTNWDVFLKEARGWQAHVYEVGDTPLTIQVWYAPLRFRYCVEPYIGPDYTP